ncbi:MAG TPA: GntR family transcriptional regulator [Candidatus Anaerofilum faecale]|nr:GntR family transcriptional regulator [Anaerofilum sp. An201]OUP04384.1 GntR family transcriptional regulator [Anaerofilum sp. An201]HIX12865.1 GntR family transcriptional regulator [Candidatus Anaerofilum faecale]
MNGMLNEQTSIYLQIAQMMENDILRGIYAEEEQVPSTNELARQFRINPATAAKGVNLLVDEGVLYKKRGIGMFVSAGAVAAIREKRKAAFYEQYVKSLVSEAANLQITQTELLEMIRRAAGAQ